MINIILGILQLILLITMCYLQKLQDKRIKKLEDKLEDKVSK